MLNLIIGIALSLTNLGFAVWNFLEGSYLTGSFNLFACIVVLVMAIQTYRFVYPYKMKDPTHIIKFYGVKCYAKLYDDTFETIGKNRVTNWLLDKYALIIVAGISASSFVLSLLCIDHTTDFILKVVAERKSHENS